MLGKMWSTEGFNIRVFVTESNELSPCRRSLITVFLQEGNLSVVILETYSGGAFFHL